MKFAQFGSDFSPIITIRLRKREGCLYALARVFAFSFDINFLDNFVISVKMLSESLSPTSLLINLLNQLRLLLFFSLWNPVCHVWRVSSPKQVARFGHFVLFTLICMRIGAYIEKGIARVEDEQRYKIWLNFLFWLSRGHQ